MLSVSEEQRKLQEYAMTNYGPMGGILDCVEVGEKGMCFKDSLL